MLMTSPCLTACDDSKKATKLQPHARFWFDDGSLLLHVQDDLYKVHRTLLHRHSNVLSSLTTSTDGGMSNQIDGLGIVRIPEGVRSGDLEVLLEHLYHDVPIVDNTSFSRIASLLKVSSERQLGFPTFHALARSQLERLFPTGPEAFFYSDDAEEALALAVEYDIPSIRKPLLYSVATHLHSNDLQVPQDDNTAASHPALTPELAARCDALLEPLVDHFTPILFTVATAGHMACTDVFAEKWMPLVIQPALDDNGLCRPLETLERIIAIDWAAEGLCRECVREKTAEWRSEQREVWERVDDWLR